MSENDTGYWNDLARLPTLTLCVGLPRSGKSSWARSVGVPIVCPDEIRLALHGQVFARQAEPFVWAIARVMVVALFGAGHRHVILDACNVTRARRQEWLDSRWGTRCHVIATPMEECQTRARAAGREDLLLVIAHMAGEWEEPGANL